MACLKQRGCKKDGMHDNEGKGHPRRVGGGRKVAGVAVVEPPPSLLPFCFHSPTFMSRSKFPPSRPSQCCPIIVNATQALGNEYILGVRPGGDACSCCMTRPSDPLWPHQPSTPPPPFTVAQKQTAVDRITAPASLHNPLFPP